MRGKAKPKPKPAAPVRITPAHAGKSTRYTAQKCKSQDHPRPCGEKSRVFLGMLKTLGSPPPMRGKAAAHDKCGMAAGITPAHAGKSRQGNNTWPCAQDHPRPCGEKQQLRDVTKQAGGSPPPMRGKGRPPVSGSSPTRITPAHAGKSRPSDTCRPRTRDHPRPCGEKYHCSGL